MTDPRLGQRGLDVTVHQGGDALEGLHRQRRGCPDRAEALVVPAELRGRAPTPEGALRRGERLLEADQRRASMVLGAMGVVGSHAEEEEGCGIPARAS
jgi:hypothetical protein